jgi:hypothetical protein
MKLKRNQIIILLACLIVLILNQLSISDRHNHDVYDNSVYENLNQDNNYDTSIDGLRYDSYMIMKLWDIAIGEVDSIIIK